MNDQAQEQAQEQPIPTEPDGWEWMLVEIMGHRTHWGRARQEERFGAKMLRIDVPNKGDPTAHGWSTHYYGGASIFSFSLTDEASVMKNNRPWDAPSRLRLPAPEEDDGDGFHYAEEASETPDREAAAS